MTDNRVYFGDDFGQKIDLTVRIREILRNYPEGTSIFKEMVQNADDAEATEVAFCLDLRQHSREGLAYEKMADFQGPSLVVYNNATFTDADFRSIQRIGDSLKKDTSKGWKTGRFGVGFNSVYHLTDLPAFVSGSHLVFFDPQACHLPNVNPSNPGKIIDFVAHPQLVRDYPAQVEPFRLFGCDFSGPFDGTVFRLALRSREQASKSRISSREMTPDHMLEMLEEFAESAELVLLFLRNVTNIKILKWDEGNEQPDLLHEASIANMNDSIRANRSLASSIIASNATSHRQFDLKGHTCDYQIDIAVSKAGCANELARFFIANQLGGGECSEMANNPANASQRLVPWGGVAFRLPSDRAPAVAEQGLAFCFLPLPTHTYLPVHVNGYFELSSNRRDIWFGDGLSGDGLLRANWNKALLKDVVAPCYARALVRMTDRAFMEPQVQGMLFPREVPPEPWDVLSQSVLRIIRKQPCLFSNANGGVWVAPSEALIIKRSTEDYEDLVQDLIADGVPVVTALTEDVEDILVKSAAVPGYAQPNVLRFHYSGHSSKHAGNLDAIKRILAFMTRDLTETSLQELNGINLLPLCDSKLTTFRKPIEGVEAAQLDQLCSMGFSRAQSLFAIRSTGRQNVEDALNWLIANPSITNDSNDHATQELVSFFIPDKDERVIFARAHGRLVDTEALPPRLHKLLSSVMGGRCLNVRSIDSEGFEDLLSAILPRDWYGKSRVPWKDDEQTYDCFNEDWIRRLWNYLGPSSHLRSLQDKWPILPTESGFFCSLSATSGVISSELLPATCITALTKIGVPLLLKNLFASVQPHTDIWSYIHQPTPGGLLSSLAASSSSKESEIKRAWSNVTRHEREHLREFLLGDACEDLNVSQRMVLSEIPVFRGLVPSIRVEEFDVMWTDIPQEENMQSGFSPVFVALRGGDASSMKVMCPGMKWYFLSEEFVSVKEDERTIIDCLNRLSVRSITTTEFLTKYLIPRLDDMPTGLRVEFTRHFLRELSAWMAEDQSGDLSRLIETMPLFPAMNGDLKRIGDLFDPDIDEFSNIMDDSFYPAMELQEPQPLSVLRSLGLQRYLSRKSILALALSVEAEQKNIMAEDCADDQLTERTLALRRRAIEFFKYIDAHMEQLLAVSTPEKQIKRKNMKMKGLKLWRSFVGEVGGKSTERQDASVKSEVEEQLAMEKSEIDDFIAKMALIAWAPVSHHLDIPLPIHCQDERVVVSRPEDVRLSRDQMLCSSQYHILAHVVRSDALRQQFKWSQPIPVEVVAMQLKAIALTHQMKLDENTHDTGTWSIVYEIYKKLSHFFEAEVDMEKRNQVLSIFSGDFDFIWAGARFVSPHRVALSTLVNAEPYLFSVSSEMLHFRPFLTAVGVRERFSTNDYVEVLAMMHKKSQTQDPRETERDTQKLSTNELVAAIGLTQLISDVLSHHTNYELFVPDANGVMRRSVEVCVDDAPWLDKHDIDLDAIRLIHPKISNEVGMKVGAKSLRSILLQANQSGTLFPTSGGDMEAFGQSEALTKRISHILEQYPDGSHIISELIQNADDAGATKVCVMFSEVTFGTSSLLSPAMAKWQGPALYVYNDAEFQDSDFISLARLGQAGKLQRVSTTGRFGLGFNSVYHFTDLPSVISANSLVIFDPHAAHLPVTPANPGIRVRFVNSSLPNQFPDQFEPYKVFGCDVGSHFHGSVFRFPLRHEGLASASEIKQRAYGKDEVFSLFESFRKTITETMLFLRNVRKVEVMIQSNPDVPPLELFSAEVPEGERGEAWRHIDRFIRGGNEGVKSESATVSKASFYSRLARTQEADLPSVSQILHIHTRERVDLDHWFHHTKRSTMDSTALSDAWTNRTEEYLVHNQVGGGRARAMACAQGNENLKLIPWVGVAGRLQKTVVEGRAFCFLPLPVKTTLPVHVNGYFELSSNRRDIWHGDDLSGDGKLRSEWNASLLEDAIAPAYVKFLLEAKQLCGLHGGGAYLSLFPVKIPAGPWGDLVTATYSIAKDKPVLNISSSALRNSGKPINPSSCVLVDENVEGWEVLEKALNTVFIDTVRIPAAIRDVMTEVGAARGKFTPSFFRSLVRSTRFLPSLDQQTAAKVIQFCLLDVRDPSARVELNEIPLVPVIDGTYKPLMVYDIQHKDPGDFESALFFATDIENGLLIGLQGRLIDYRFKAMFEGVNKYSNLFQMTPHYICERFLPKLLPAEWSRQTHEPRLWNPTVHIDHPSSDWLRLWWSYVEHTLDDAASEHELQSIERVIRTWPLAPVVRADGQRGQMLISAGERSMSAVVRLPSSTLPTEATDSLPSVLHKIGVATIDPSFVTGNLTVAWMLKKSLIFQLSLNGFLSALARFLHGEQQGLHNAFVDLDENERKILEDFITSDGIDQLDRDNMVLFRRLPIFRVYGDLGCEESFSTLESNVRLAGENADVRVLGPSFFVAPPKSSIRRFLQRAGIEEWSSTRVLLEHVLPHLDSLLERAGAELVNSVVQNALLELPFHQRQDSAFRDVVMHLPIILSEKMNFRRIPDLYDPSKRDLGELVGPNSLPHKDFGGKEMIAVLRSLGLRDSLSCHAIVESAKSIEAMVAEGLPTEDTWKKAQSLLKLVNRSFDDLIHDYSSHTNEPSSMDIDDAVSTLSTTKWLPIHNAPFKPFLPWPLEFDPGRRFASACTTRPECDAWKCSSSRDILAGDLKSEVLLTAFGWNDPIGLVTMTAQLVAISESVRLSGRSDISSPDFKVVIQETQQLYQVLNDACCMGDSDLAASMCETLRPAAWVWTGSRFAKIQQIALNSDSALEPLLFAPPPDVLVPRSLLTVCGLKEDFDINDYVLALRSLSSNRGVLPQTERNTCIKLLERIASLMLSEDSSSRFASNALMLLDEQDRLIPASELVYDDMEWNESSEVRRGCRFVNKHLSREVALTLGATSLHSRLAETSMSSTRLVCPSTGALKKILPRRDHWFDVFFREMLLAAERVGGSQVDFFVDYRKHASQRVIQPSFQVLQEEAICVHIHDVVLSTQDVNGLYGGEMSRPGLLTGFTFSDCLQILSGDGFYVLDPTSKFLSPSSSGGMEPKGAARRYNILGEDFLRYPDQLLPFCTLPSLSGNVSGGTRSTLLRFPLRKEHSALSSYVLTEKSVERFIKYVQAQLGDCLVFTEAVHRVAIWSIGKASEFASDRHGEVALESGLDTLRRRNSTRQNNEWKKKFSFQSFFKAPVTPENQIEFSIDVEIDNKRFKDVWLLSDNVGAGRSRDLASSPVHEVLNSTPYVSVACHLLRDGKPARPVRGKLFKIVKLAQDVGLPVHINGCFKKPLSDSLVHFNSTTTGQNDEQAISAHWNRVLLEDGAVEAYSRLLHHAKRVYGVSYSKAFYRVWPVNVDASNFVASQVQQQLLRKLQTQDVFLCSDGSYRTLREGYVVDTRGMDLQVISFAQLHFPSFDVPADVLNDAKRLLPSQVYSLAPRTMRRYMRNVRASDIHSSMCLSLLEYCLSDLSFPLPPDGDSVWGEFQGLPLLPLEDGSVGNLGVTRRGRHILASFNQIQLLPSLSSTFVSLEARQRLHSFFSDSRFIAQMGLGQFTIKTLSDNIDKVLPAAWRDRSVVDWVPGRDGHPSQAWMHRFWSEVRFERRSLAYFSAWPLIPVQNSRLVSCGKPNTALCVWRGALNEVLRDQLGRVVNEATLQNERKLASLEAERAKLCELASQDTPDNEIQDSSDILAEDNDELLLSGDPDVDEEIAEDRSESQAVGVASTDAEESNQEFGTNETHSQLVEAFDTPSDTGAAAQVLGAEFDPSVVEQNGAIYDEVGHGADGVNEVFAVEHDLEENDDNNSRPALHDLLSRLHVPLIELAYLADQETEIIPSGRTIAVAVLEAVCASDQTTAIWTELAADDATQLAEYFADHNQRYGCFTRTHLEMLKKLPIYVNISGQPCALNQGDHFSVPSEINLAAIPLPPDASERFMRPNPRMASFYRDLGVDDMSYGKLLVFLLPFHGQLSNEQQASVLALIKEKWPSLRGDSAVVGVLRATPLFASDDGSLKCAAGFFDPRNKVFSALFANTRGTFPCEPMRSSEAWLDLMAEIGLRSEITVELFVECARRLEALYAEKASLSAEDERVINALHEFFLQNFDKYDRSRVFFDQVGSIRFVPAVIHENSLAGQDNSNTPSSRTILTTYTNCAIPEDQALVFTCTPIISTQALPPRVLWSRLGLQSPPPKASVLKNLFHIVDTAGESISESWLFFVPIVESFQAIFKYLQEEWDRFALDERDRLTNTPLIPVGSRLVKGSRLFFHLAENLAPVMFEAPRAFGAYDALFRRLGSKDSPEAEDYVVVLRDLAEECGGSPLNLNELLSVSRIVSLLADEMVEHNKALSVDAMQQLHLPSTQSIMCQAVQMAYNDDPWICTRVDLTELQVVHPRVTLARCDVLGVKGISHVVSEQLDVREALGEPTPQSQDIQHMNHVIASQQFGNGLRTLISVQHQKMSTSVIADFDELHRRIVNVGTYRVRAVDTLRTRFVAQFGHPPRSVDVTKASTAAASISFVDTSSNTIYIASNTLRSNNGVRVAQVVAGRINQLLGGSIHDCSAIESMLSIDVLQIQPLLQLLNIQDDPALISEKLRGTYGELLCDRDLQLAELAPLRSFYIGEVVAVEYSGGLRYAKIVKEEAFANGINRYEVRIQQAETRWYPASQIFSFKSFRGLSRTSSTQRHDRNAAFVERLTSAWAGPNTTANPSAALPPSVVARGPPASGTTSQRNSSISPVTVVAAVNDLLGRMNLSLASTYDELLAENQRLSRQLEQAEEGRRLAAAQVETALREKRDAQETLVCMICLENKVDRVLIPCGHIYCSGCVSQLSRQTCPVCRQTIASTSQFHVPS